MRLVFESPYHVLASTGNIDLLKYIVNGIADVNDEEPLTDKIAFSHTPQQIKRRRSCRFMLKNLLNSRDKSMTLGILSLQWFAYASA
jgi:hypothetical protein